MRQFFRLKIPKRLKGKKGFTLVELIFEILVLSLLIIPTALLLGNLTLNVVETDTNSMATSLCVQKAEEVLGLLTYDSVVGGSGTFATEGEGYPDYSYTVSVLPCVDDPYLNQPSAGTCAFKKATVKVSHTGIADVETSLLFTKF